jgi:hypothetical protein
MVRRNIAVFYFVCILAQFIAMSEMILILENQQADKA